MLRMVNVGFGNVVAAQRIVAIVVPKPAPKEIVTQVRERGSGITLACGTGACATAVAANLNGLAGKSATVHLDGGDLHIDWRANNHVYMTGAAEKVFAGNFLC